MQNFKEAYSRYHYATKNILAKSKQDYEVHSNNVTHRINADGDHEFKGSYRHKIFKKDDTEGLDDYLKHIHDDVLGHGNIVVLNSGTSDQKLFNGGAPGVDKLKQTILGKNESVMKTFNEYNQLDEVKLGTIVKIVKHAPKVVSAAVGATVAMNSAEPPKQPIKPSIPKTTIIKK